MSTVVLASVTVLAQVLAQASDEIPDEMAYVWGAYGLVIVTLVAYAAYTVRRGRTVLRQLPPDERRWGS